MRKHFIRLLAPARVNDVLHTPDDGIQAVTEGEKLRLVDGQGVAEDLTDEFEPAFFDVEDDAPDAATDAPADAPVAETPKPSAARKPRKTKG